VIRDSRKLQKPANAAIVSRRVPLSFRAISDYDLSGTRAAFGRRGQVRNIQLGNPFASTQSGEAVMTTFKMIGGVCLAVALAAASPAMARSGHGRHFHHHGFAASVFAAAALEGFTYYGGYLPRGENYPYYWDAGYVPEPHYVSGPCQPGTIFFGEDGERHLCE
jgi:hypothetical protein